MTASLSYDELMALKPCDAYRRKDLFKNAERLTARQAFAAGASVSDLAWVAGRLGLKRECVQFALACARRAAHLNTDPCVQAAIDAAQAWLDEPSDLNAAAAFTAARAAENAAAYAAVNAAVNAAKAAANAAYAVAIDFAEAAYDAAAAAARAANAAAKAAAYAAAAYAAALAAEKEEQKRLFLEIFDPQ